MRQPRPVRVIALVVVGMLLAACGAAASPTPATQPTAPPTGEPTAPPPPEAGSLTVLSLWGGSERANFLAVIDGFTAKTGIAVQYETARDFLPVMRTRLAAGNPPMIAIIPRPGVMVDLAKDGAIIDLETLGITNMSDNYSQAWLDLGTAEGKMYGVAVKANSKSTMWYKPASFQALGVEPPTDWDGLVAIADKYVAAGKIPFAVGGKDSWTLTDWFENIYVRTAGPDKYSELFGGTLPFNDQTVKDAMKRMADLIAVDKYVAGGRQGVLGTGFVDGIGRVFGTSADAEMYYEGGFVGGIALGDVNPSLTPVKDIAFFTFPQIDPAQGTPLIGGGDLAVAFVDNDLVRQFMAYLTSKDSADIWASTGTISPNKNTDTSKYPTPLAIEEAKQVAGAEVFRFDGSDLLPGTLGEAWGTTLQGVIENPDNIDGILNDFEELAKAEFGR
jgi:ABC-type Fe3+ transport system substrate-binding protein